MNPTISSPIRITLVAAVILGSAGCRSTDYFKAKRIEEADRAFMTLQRQIIEGRSMTLVECIDEALKHNIDISVGKLQEAIAHERKTAAKLGMLPDLTISYERTGRNNDSASRSVNVETGADSLVSSYSSERREHSSKVELLVSTLDFGLAYMNSEQAADREEFAMQQHRRTAQNVVFEVVKAYFRVATAQHAIETTQAMLVKSQEIEKTLEELEANKMISPLQALSERKQLISMRKQLMESERSYDNCRTELCSLLGYAPSSDFKVDTSCLNQFRPFAVPEVEKMDRLALHARPELFQNDTQADMLLWESRKAILNMFPNVQLFGDLAYSSNKYLYNQAWWEVGARSAYNLLRLPGKYKEYQAIGKEQKQVDLQQLALSLGIISQVHICYGNIVEVEARYTFDDRIFQAYQRQLELARQDLAAGGSSSRFYVNRLELETAQAAIDRIRTLGDYYVSYYRLINSIGVGSIAEDELIRQADAVETEAVRRALKRYSR
jgi:outer membrane protein TolC